MSEAPVAASASRCDVCTFDGPAPKRPSAGNKSVGIGEAHRPIVAAVTSTEAGASTLRLVQVGYEHPDAHRLIEAVQEEYVVRYGGRDGTPLDPLMFVSPHGSFFVGYLGAEAVASGAWRAAEVTAFGEDRVAEIKRMYVVPQARGRGLARAVLAHLERTAVEAGHRAMVLETGRGQPEAIALYESSGYTAIPRFGFYADYDTAVHLGKLL